MHLEKGQRVKVMLPAGESTGAYTVRQFQGKVTTIEEVHVCRKGKSTLGTSYALAGCKTDWGSAVLVHRGMVGVSGRRGSGMNQREQIYDYMTDFGSITPMEAFADLGITKLATRVSEMRKEGVDIIGEWKSTKNRYGKTVRYMRYRLGEQNNG